MGILNVTPDSFSDGGRFNSRERAVERALRLIDDGADILDVGGESTRPGAAAVSEAEEARRVVPVIRAVATERPGAVISVDTTKASVAEAAIEAGAVVLNDVSALTQDVKMKDLAAASRAGVVLMHMRGTPRTMQDSPVYDDVVGEVATYLRSRIEELVEFGIAEEALAVDPGIGFGKTLQHNLQLLAGMDTFVATGRPVVVGLSRKRFLGMLTEREVEQRLAGSLAGLAYCVMRGAHVMRVHDVCESVDAVRVLSALRETKGAGRWIG